MDNTYRFHIELLYEINYKKLIRESSEITDIPFNLPEALKKIQELVDSTTMLDNVGTTKLLSLSFNVSKATNIDD